MRAKGITPLKVDARFVRDYAAVLHNPSSLPHNYSANLAAALGVIWGIITIIVVATIARRR